MYFITMLDIKNQEAVNVHTVGYYDDKEEAKEKIQNNENAMFIKGEDSYYNYALLSTVSMGMDINIEEVKWFKYNRTETLVDITTEEFGPETIRRVDISIDEVEAPEGFENYKPVLFA